ncbi:alpha/beta hydrolase [Prosthecobacter dejongeii]|uniref:Acetyl esterase/lipase n=1 Tax=Prosthecobacter dejongeii TaxID=48465 RepID=A0A7W7YQU6_9BACT|nr:alpha/beta hydrolase [Prosthecobacter dejongeii]MBB5040482.1 acetyl esterase/lipase [Prosthecobacter dejongeii]
MKCFLCLFTALVFTVINAKAQVKKMDPVDELAATLTPTRSVIYKKVADRELSLHVFEPDGHLSTDRRACYITIHGGGWTGGNAKRMYPFAAHYRERGLVGISVEYRLHQPKEGVTVFDCVKDARSALRYVRAHSQDFGIDPQKIIVSGGSAGGHLAVATALFADVNEAGEDTSISAEPNALVLLFPVIDCSPDGYGQVKIGKDWKKISPVHQVKAGLPPTITFHGTGDTVTPFIGAQRFHDSMLKLGNRSELVVNESGTHGYLMRDRVLLDDTFVRSDAFLTSLGLMVSR